MRGFAYALFLIAMANHIYAQQNHNSLRAKGRSQLLVRTRGLEIPETLLEEQVRVRYEQGTLSAMLETGSAQAYIAYPACASRVPGELLLCRKGEKERLIFFSDINSQMVNGTVHVRCLEQFSRSWVYRKFHPDLQAERRNQHEFLS